MYIKKTEETNMEGKDILKGITLEELLKKAVEAKAEITVTMGPDNTEVRVEPWKPFEYVCPAGHSAPEKMPGLPDPGQETVIAALGLNLWERVCMFAFANKMSFQDTIRGMLKNYLEEQEAQGHG